MPCLLLQHVQAFHCCLLPVWTLQRNTLQDTAQAVTLTWGQPLPVGLQPPYDVILCSDLVYCPASVQPLLSTISALAGPNSTILYACEFREGAGLELFHQLLPQHSLQEQLVGGHNAAVAVDRRRRGWSHALPAKTTRRAVHPSCKEALTVWLCFIMSGSSLATVPVTVSGCARLYRTVLNCAVLSYTVLCCAVQLPYTELHEEWSSPGECQQWVTWRLQAYHSLLQGY
jgi:hypothetical protein